MFQKQLLVLFSLITWMGMAQERDACKMIALVQLKMRQLHVEPIEDNEQSRKEIMQLFVQEIDAENLLFYQEEIDSLKELAASKELCFAYKATRNLYRKRLRDLHKYYQQQLAAPMNLSQTSYFVFNEQASGHLRPKHPEQQNYRLQSLKHDYLNMAWEHFNKDSTLNRSPNEELDAIWRKKMLDDQEESINEYLGDSMLLEDNLLNAFLDGITRRFDPHSNFMTLSDKKAFEAELSEERLVFGLDFEEDKEKNLWISSVFPGSPAWKSNAIFEGDQLVALIDPKGRRTELAGKGMSYLSKVLDDIPGNKATFVIKNKAGIIQEVSLVRAKVENSENAFTAYLLGEKGEQVGYLALPSFYTDFEGDKQLGCANDVAREILLLKKDSIKGLIIDLRNNGGGSLREAIELSGLFINEGPMAVYKTRNEKPFLLKDMNRGTVYDGPLMVLINNQSASASEFFAGCMQDYQRALIVGGRSYGKATAQGMYPIDSIWMRKSQNFIKVTEARFYHVSSRSNQAIGIVPDISIPDLYSEIDFWREEKQAWHLPNDSVMKKVNYQVHKLPFTAEILTKARQRIQSSSELNEVKEQARSLRKLMQEDQKIPLTFEAYMRYADEERKQWEGVRKKVKPKQATAVQNHSFHTRMLAYDEDKSRMNDLRLQNISNDLLLHESYQLFKELFNFEHQREAK